MNTIIKERQYNPSRFSPKALVNRGTLMLKVAKERRILLKLEEHELRDIGITSGDAHFEANRKFWDI